MITQFPFFIVCVIVFALSLPLNRYCYAHFESYQWAYGVLRQRTWKRVFWAVMSRVFYISFGVAGVLALVSFIFNCIRYNRTGVL